MKTPLAGWGCDEDREWRTRDEYTPPPGSFPGPPAGPTVCTWLWSPVEADGRHPRFGLNVKTDDATRTPRGAAEASPAFQPAADGGSQMRRRQLSPARPAEVAAPGTAFPAAAAAAARSWTNPTHGPARPIRLAPEATLPLRSEGRRGEIQVFGDTRQVFGGKGGAGVGRMRREGRCCPFKRRRPSRDLFSFPGRKAEPGLGAQGGEVRDWAWGGGARAAGTPPSRPPCGLPFCLPEPPPSRDRRRQRGQGGAARTGWRAGCLGQGRR
ncbi:uncharacterized protein LOC123620729 isoform X2 [Lemur catta]|uniref:uncharacterized protein LOC123620729 isoform X2 n=1 Tax=Lemur catta TaxID=9447 RepID=UPI001E269667|nr:uncharacterized protein LOC123620729 isoform X2 [Lemur catta]